MSEAASATFGVRGKPLENAWPYFLVTGLLYPGVLGALLAWLAQGIGAHAFIALGASVAPTANPPSWLAIAVGAWFALYHGSWFLRLQATFSAWSSNPAAVGPIAYTGKAFASDLIECFAPLMVLGSLGAGLPPLTADSHAQLAVIFGAVVSICGGVAVAYSMEMAGLRLLLVWPAAILALVGLVLNIREVMSPEAPKWTHNTEFIAVLWLLLLCYLAWIFGWLRRFAGKA